MAKNIKIFMNLNNTKTTSESYQTEIDRIIDYSKASGKQSMRRKLGTFLSDPTANLTMNIVNSIFSLVLVFNYIFSTYNIEPFQNLAWGTSNFLFHLYFLVEFLMRFYTAKNRKQSLLKSDSLVDIVSLIPFFVVRFVFLNPFFEDNTNWWVVLANSFCLMRILKIEGCLTFIVIKTRFLFIK